MRYSFEFKVACIDKYRQGLWPVTPEGIKEEKGQKVKKKCKDNLGKQWIPKEHLVAQETEVSQREGPGKKKL